MRLLNKLSVLTVQMPPDPEPKPRLARIGVARDEAFCFYYAENLRLLEQAGAETGVLLPFAGLKFAARIWTGCTSAAAIPNSTPTALARNTTLLSEILAFGRSLKPVYAECGGFMYLMDHIEAAEEERYFMVGLFDMRCRLGDRFRALGYRERWRP